MVMSPDLVLITTSVMPGPAEVCRDTSTRSRSLSQATSRSALGLIRSAVTDADVTFSGYWSSAAASSARHGVIRVQARSVLPVAYDEHCRWIALVLPRVTAAESVIRRCANAPSGSDAGSSGASVGHQMATGESGSSRGSTTDSACLTTSPLSRIRAVSPLHPEPVPTWAFTTALPRASPRMTPSTRAGCSFEAARAEAIASSEVSSSTTMIRVITMPIAGEPALVRARTSSAAMPAALVSVSSIISRPPPGRGAPAERAGGVRSSGSPPDAAVAGQHGVCGLRAPVARLVLLGLRLPGSILLGPVLEHGVEDLPGQLDLVLLGEQRRVTEEYVEDQSLVGLRTGLG